MTIGTSGLNRHPSGAQRGGRPQEAAAPTVPPWLTAWINRALDAVLKGIRDDAYIH